MRSINIENKNKRDAVVGFEISTEKKSLKKVTKEGNPYKNVKFLKSLVNIKSLQKKYGDLTDIGKAIINGDPEIDIELTGKFINKTRKLFVNDDFQIIYHVNLMKVVHNPDGSEKERKNLDKALSNINTEIPIKWTGMKFSKEEAIHKFIFTKKYQLYHTSGLSYDFLYEMAEDLDKSNSLMFVGGGSDGSEPIVITAGGKPYRAFLEGRVDGDKYCLILHLTDLELKPIHD